MLPTRPLRSITNLQAVDRMTNKVLMLVAIFDAQFPGHVRIGMRLKEERQLKAIACERRANGAYYWDFYWVGGEMDCFNTLTDTPVPEYVNQRMWEVIFGKREGCTGLVNETGVAIDTVMTPHPAEEDPCLDW